MKEICFPSAENIRHAYIISSPDPQAAFSQALRIAQAAVCRGNAPLPCLRCSACRKTALGTHPDVTVTERLIDDKGKQKREILVGQIRQLSADAVILPNEAPGKVYIIRDADTMNEEAQNAALKLLEEPPNHAVFLLCVSNAERLLATVRSRCEEHSVPAAAAADNAEMAALAEEYLKKVSANDAFALWQFCESNNTLSYQEMTDFCLAAAQKITDMLCGRCPSSGMTQHQLLAREKLMEKCVRYLKVNVNVKQVFALLEADSIS